MQYCKEKTNYGLNCIKFGHYDGYCKIHHPEARRIRLNKQIADTSKKLKLLNNKLNNLESEEEEKKSSKKRSREEFEKDEIFTFDFDFDDIEIKPPPCKKRRLNPKFEFKFNFHVHH